MKSSKVNVALLSAMVAAVSVVADGQTQPSASIDDTGTVHISAFEVPLSSYMSPEARRAFIDAAHAPHEPEWDDINASIATLRELDERDSKELVERAKARYPVNIEEGRIDGVHTRLITPKEGVAPRNRHRVLIELHGGGFFSGADSEALLESIPVARVGGIKVVAVDYREGPEYRFPAASEDVAKVYRELLKQYRAADIGLYGCSAGGTLSAMAVAWFQKEKLPRPGAIGILNAGAFGSFDAPPSNPGSWGGDSRYTTPPLVGDPPLPADPNKITPFPTVMTAYLRAVNLGDPLASPALSKEVLAQFPPSLVITSTRGFDMSAAVETHRRLVNAGVPADLHVWDGVGHCFFTDVTLPESQEAFSVIARFFDQHLGQ